MLVMSTRNKVSELVIILKFFMKNDFDNSICISSMIVILPNWAEVNLKYD